MRRVFLIILFLLAYPVAATGAEIKVVTEAWPPYSYKEDGKTMGVVTEIVEETLKRSGLEYSIEVYPWARAYDMAQNNENVLIYSIFKLPNRVDLFKWIKIEGLSINMYLFSPKHRDDISLCSLEDAKRYRIGVTRETSTHHYLNSKGFEEGVNLFPVNCEEQNALKSAPQSKRIDLTTGDRLSLAHWLSVAGLPSDYWVARLPLFHEDFYMAFGKKTSDEMVEKVRRAFQEVREEGLLNDIVAKYYLMFGTDPVPAK